MHITSAFDSGNIEVVELSGDTARLRIRQDTESDFYQWFNFRVSGAKGRAVNLRIENASGAAYPKGWEGYNACISADRESWTRLPGTAFDGEALTLEFTPDSDLVQIAYFAPYTYDRHLDLVAGMAKRDGVKHRVLGQTLQGRPMDAFTIGEGALDVWVIARQHPGESMAEWWMEGFLDALLLNADAQALMRFHVVPNMNPDGSFLGNLRTNAVGANLNREWNVATPERSPEVLCVRNAMDAAPPALCLDVHGDEALPYNFIAGSEGIPGFTDTQREELRAFLEAYKDATPEFQTRRGYAVTAPGKANLGMCTNYTAHAYGGLAMTLEMPFKDNADMPEPGAGWSPERCRQLGRDVLAPMLGWARGRA